MLKDGVAVIALIAGAVLAIGLAFKIVGTVDFVSVIAISAALVLIAVAFEKVASIEGLTPDKVFVVGLSLIGMSIAIAASSVFLQMVQPIGIFQALTIVFIGAAFGAAAYGLGQLIRGFGDINPAQALIASAILPLILIGTSFAIAKSSVILQEVQPIGFFQALTVILIAAAFGVAAFGLGKLIKSFDGINPASALVASILMPIVLVGLSLAITESSKILGDVVIIGFFQAISAIMIAGVLVVLSYAVKPLMQGVKGVNPVDVLVGGLVILGLVTVLTISSHILQDFKSVGLGVLFNFTMMGLALSLITFILSKPIQILGKMNIKEIFMGSVAIVLIAGAITLSSLLINLGTYDNYPSFGWAAGVGVGLLLFAIPIASLGALIMITGGLVGGALLIGAAAVIGIASLFPIIDSILSSGSYTKYPSFGWAAGVGLSLVGLAIGVAILGTISSVGAAVESVTKFLPVPTIQNPIDAGLEVVPKIAMLMPLIDSIISSGSYTKYPSFEWAKGVGLSLVGLAIGVAVLGTISSVGAAVERITDWIPFVKIENPITAGMSVVTKIAELMPLIDGIISSGDYTKYPGEDWAKGVGLSIVFLSLSVAVLGIISSVGAAVEKITSWIPIAKVENPIDAGIRVVPRIARLMPLIDKIISQGDYTKYPGEDWAKGVGGSMIDFSAAVAVLGLLSKKAVDQGIQYVNTLSNTIIDTSIRFNEGKFDKYPGEKYVDGVISSLKKFSKLSIGSFGSYKSKVISTLAQSIRSTSLIFDRGKFDKYPQKEYIDGVIYALKKFSTIVSLARGLDTGPGLINRGLAALTGGSAQSPLDKAVSNIEKLATAFEKLGSAFKTLSGSIEEIDGDKLSLIKGMSSNVIMMSLMDPTQFKSMMDALEEKGGIFADLAKDFDEKKSSSPSLSPMGIGGVSVKPDEKSDIEILTKKMDSMIAILGDMSQVMGSSGTLNNYLNSIKDNQLDGDRHRSDVRLKNIIKHLGLSKLGINIYLFEYKFNPGTIYQGVIAQELLGTEWEESLIKDSNGFYSVDYSKIDIKFKKVETIS